MTYFQMKFAAKQHSRAYHGETIKEKHWRRMFRPDSRSVVSMTPGDLANWDGSDQAAGRGSGLQKRAGREFRLTKVPYMNMVYHQTERRLDTAIFRALFASSTRQARQFCVHGAVKVNGKKVNYSSFPRSI
jgi:ribosomal protein S4